MSFKTFTHWTPKICLLWIENIFQTHLLLKQPFTFAAFLFSNLIFRLWTTDLTSQTTEVGNNYACRSKCLLLLNLQWYGNIKIILLFFRLFLLMLVTILQTFFFLPLGLLRCGPSSANKSSNYLTDIMKYVRKYRYSFNLWIKPISSFYCLEISASAYYRLILTQVFSHCILWWRNAFGRSVLYITSSSPKNSKFCVNKATSYFGF